MNVGQRWQVLYWPRWTLFFYRSRPVKGIYRFIVYVWPIEVRLFSRRLAIRQEIPR